MYHTFIELTSRWPYAAAFVEFAILGMAGEWISSLLRRNPISGGFLVIIGKMLCWGVLGVVIKLSFIGFDGFTRGVFSSLSLPAGYMLAGVVPLFAVGKSVFANLFFGPQMMLFHRFEDNLVTRKTGFQGMKPAIATLVWFWIPAHAFTFSLRNPELQVALAALWSVVLGLILGLSNRPGNKSSSGGKKKGRQA